jgi:hypothetical protein
MIKIGHSITTGDSITLKANETYFIGVINATSNDTVFVKQVSHTDYIMDLTKPSNSLIGVYDGSGNLIGKINNNTL